MVAALVPAGMTTGDAVVAVILYRLVSWAIVTDRVGRDPGVDVPHAVPLGHDHADDLEEGLRAGAPPTPTARWWASATNAPMAVMTPARPDDDGSSGGDDAGDSPSRRRR